MANLSASLRPASFRGVAFKVNASDFGAGRRTQVHEYPQRDKPYAEDLGRATREIRITGFVVGADYVDQANKLIAALETSGPGTLVHPWLGTLQVSVKDLAGFSFDEALGVARVQMAFVEAGELAFPAAAAATQAQTRSAASKIESAAQNTFAKKFSVAGMPGFVSAAASGNLGTMFAAIGGNAGLSSVLGYAQKATSSLATVQGLLSSPLRLAQGVAGFLGLSQAFTTGSLIFSSTQQMFSTVKSLIALAGGSALAAPVAGVALTAQAAQMVANQDAVNELARQTLLAQAVGLSGSLDLPVYQDAVDVRTALVAALDAESLTASDDAFEALQEARGRVYADLTDRSRDSARLVPLTPPEATPATVIAYDLYEDSDRDLEIVARNKIARPGFVWQAIQVLSR